MDVNQSNVSQNIAPPPYSGPADENCSDTMIKPVTNQPQVAVASSGNPPPVYLTEAAPNVIVGNRMSPQPTALKCKSCNEHIVTRTEWTPSKKTHVIAALFCIICFWPCAAISYSVDSWRNTQHYCPNCDAQIKHTPRNA